MTKHAHADARELGAVTELASAGDDLMCVQHVDFTLVRPDCRGSRHANTPARPPPFPPCSGHVRARERGRAAACDACDACDVG